MGGIFDMLTLIITEETFIIERRRTIGTVIVGNLVKNITSLLTQKCQSFVGFSRFS